MERVNWSGQTGNDDEGKRHMDVEILIRYSDDRLCLVTVARPDGGDILYQIVTPVAGIPQSVGEGLREARRTFAMEPWQRPARH
jgi:hypothetical protein